MAEIALAGAIAVLRQAAGVVANLVVQEGSRLFRLQEDIAWIETEMRHIQSYLEDAEAKQEINRGVANLIIDIRDLSFDVEDTMEKYFPRLASHKRKGFSGCLKSTSCILCYGSAARDFLVEIERIKRKVENIGRVRQTYNINERVGGDGRDVWDERRTFPHVEEPNIVGFDEHIDKLVARLSNERVISVVGMAGLGKTTLARKVYKSVQRNFECSAWIYISQQPNIKELVRDIARQVGMEKEKWEANCEDNLFTHLSQHRYVIVLDDMWHIEPWEALTNVLPTNFENGSRIILTSRHRDVGVHVGGMSSLHELQPLNEESSKELFFNMVLGSPRQRTEANDPPQFDPPELEGISEQILKRCGGVPLAIVLAAGILLVRERSENAWRGVLEGIGQDQHQGSQVFALSYKDLPTNLKPCFLYLGLFPEDREISAFELVNLWAAEGFIRGSAVREVEDVGEDHLNHLIARNLIQVVRRRSNGMVRSLRIHDILHSLCILVAKEINFFNAYVDVINPYPASRVRRVTTHGKDSDHYLSSDHQAPELRALLCFNGSKSQGKSFKNFLRGSRFLRVIRVEFRSGYVCLPNEIGNLRRLTYLKLTSYWFGKIELPYAISNLVSLQTLDVQESKEVILPNVIWKMKELRHVFLPRDCTGPSFGGVSLDLFHPIEVSLPNLQTLYGMPPELFKPDWLHKLTNLRTLRVYYPTDRVMEVLSDPTPVTHNLEKLRLSVFGWTSWNLSRYEKMRKLHLDDMIFAELPGRAQLPPNLTKITLECTEMKKDIVETLKKLQKLKILKLVRVSHDGEELVFSGEPGNFPQLEVLEINRLFNVKLLVVKEGGMPKLKDLRIIYCNLKTQIPDRIRNVMNRRYRQVLWQRLADSLKENELRANFSRLKHESLG